jgi:hypothetical protein
MNPIRIFRALLRRTNIVATWRLCVTKYRALEKVKFGASYEDRKQSGTDRKERKEQVVLPVDPLDDVFPLV